MAVSYWGTKKLLMSCFVISFEFISMHYLHTKGSQIVHNDINHFGVPVTEFINYINRSGFSGIY